MAGGLQMNWQPSLIVNQKRKKGPPLGLKNLGNTCYLNSVLQCLTYTPPLANFCLRNQHSSSCDSSSAEHERKTDCPFCVLEKRIVRSLSIDLSLDTPGKVNSCLKIFAEHFRFGRQEDAHEFLRYVIDACHNTCLRLKKLQQQRRKAIVNGGDGEGLAGSSTVVKEIFGGALQSQVKCLSCGALSNKVDEIMDISLEVLHSSSIKEALQKFFQPEVLDGSNKYKCDNCKKLVAARKQLSILQAPNVLVIQLKRFEGIFGGKIDKAITLEEVLVLSSHMCKASQDPLPEYKLFATIVHSGFSPDSGHYYAYIKDVMGRWYCCNDTYVSLSTLQEVLSEKAYILFFSRTKQRPARVNTSLAANGIKSNGCNGSGTSKIPKSGHTIKPLNKNLDHPSENGKSTAGRVDKVPSSPKMKISSIGNIGVEQSSTTMKFSNGVHKRESNDKNGHVKIPASVGLIENTLPPFKDQSGVNKSILVDAVDCGENLSASLVNGNGQLQSVNGNSSVADRHEDNGTRNRLSIRSGSNQELENGSVNGFSDSAGSKRKTKEENVCIFFSDDTQFRAELEEFKEALKKKASSVLRSCGWSDKVYNFMHSRKKLCAQAAGNDASNSNEIKRMLIADAKPTFLSQIPESLKGDFIERLRSFSQAKQRSGP